MRREFTVIIEKDKDGWFVATVPELKGCHTQAKSLDKLMARVREAIDLCMAAQKQARRGSEFVGVHRVAVET
jgi:predicted RNase H-like HicB family nuclease